MSTHALPSGKNILREVGQGFPGLCGVFCQEEFSFRCPNEIAIRHDDNVEVTAFREMECEHVRVSF